jgi:anthranilate/para-aminobenzoate synthase component II
VFRGVGTPIVAARYHSLAISPDGWPEDLEIAARAEDGTIMAARHRRWPVHGVQFHPESVLTAEGRNLLRNFLEM